MLQLSSKWARRVNSQGETGMHYVIVTVILKDGRQFPQTIIAGGTITKIRGLEDIPFKEDDIEDLVATHDKWDWSKE